MTLEAIAGSRRASFEFSGLASVTATAVALPDEVSVTSLPSNPQASAVAGRLSEVQTASIPPCGASPDRIRQPVAHPGQHLGGIDSIAHIDLRPDVARDIEVPVQDRNRQLGR